MTTEKILAKLISFPTLSLNQKKNKEALEWVEKILKELPLHTKKISHNGFWSLVATTKKTKTPTLWLQAHIDVVGASTNFFKAENKNGKIFGRGAFDMKYAIACYIKACIELKKTLKNYDVGIMLTSDEELGGENGVKTLLQKGYVSEFCFLPDGGKEWTLQTSTKGVLQATATATGKAGHGARPWEGENAIELLMKFLQKLKKNIRTKNRGASQENQITLNIGKISGGTETNKIPEYAEAEIDIRLPAPISKKKIGEIIKTTEKSCAEKIKTDEKIFATSFSVDPHSPFIQKFRKIVKKVRGESIQTGTSFGSCDARYFSEKNIPTIVMRPRGGGHHSNKEWISAKDLKIFTNVVKKMIQEMASENKNKI